MADAPAGSTIQLSDGSVSEKLTVDKDITLQGTTEEGKSTILEQGITLASNNEPISVTVKNMTLQNGSFGLHDNNNGPEANSARNAYLTFEDCVIKDFTGKGIYTADARVFKMKNCKIENCATGTDTGIAGDYAVDLNLIGVKSAVVELENCEFVGYCGAKAAFKVTQRGGPSDEGAGDIPMDKGQSYINNVTITGCSFDTETPVDVRLGTEHKTPDQPDLENTTANFPVMISGNKTEINVHVAPTGKSYVVPVGGTGYKNGAGEFTVIGEETPDGPVTIGDKAYETLEDAIVEAKSGDTITLNEDIVVNDMNQDSLVAVTIPAGVTLDGQNHKISAPEVAGKHILGAVDNGVTIKNVVIEGNANVKSGICASGVNAVLTINGVTVNNCGNCGVQITNGAKVTLTNYNSSGNAWGSVNADKGGGGNNPQVTFNSGSMSENVELYTEVLDATVITAPSLTEVIGVGDILKGFKYYTSDMSRLGVAAVVVDGKTTVYEDMIEAEEAAEDAGVDVVIL